MSRIRFVFVLFLREFLPLDGVSWEKDLSSAMRIGLSRSGYQSVDLKCGPEWFEVNVTLAEDFRGVVYTRGSFSEKRLPCFKRHYQKTPTERNETLISLKIPFRECGTVMDVAESCHTNTIVVQHDPELIMPGDAAFSLDCAFAPEFKVDTRVDFKGSPFESRITLVDADPSGGGEEPPVTAASRNDAVTFLPDAGVAKDEL